MPAEYMLGAEKYKCWRKFPATWLFCHQTSFQQSFAHLVRIMSFAHSTAAGSAVCPHTMSTAWQILAGLPSWDTRDFRTGSGDRLANQSAIASHIYQSAGSLILDPLPSTPDPSTAHEGAIFTAKRGRFCTTFFRNSAQEGAGIQGWKAILTFTTPTDDPMALDDSAPSDTRRSDPSTHEMDSPDSGQQIHLPHRTKPRPEDAHVDNASPRSSPPPRSLSGVTDTNDDEWVLMSD